jgi:hypothetical protein
MAEKVAMVPAAALVSTTTVDQARLGSAGAISAEATEMLETEEGGVYVVDGKKVNANGEPVK